MSSQSSKRGALKVENKWQKGSVWDFNSLEKSGVNQSGQDRQRIYNKSLYHGDIFKKY